MLRKALFLLMLSVFSFTCDAQLEYEKKVLETLCSDSLFGRGYAKNGVNRAANFLKDEMQIIGLSPGLDTSFFQPFSIQVNTFPDDPIFKLNGNQLKLGEDYLPHPASGSFSGKITSQCLDSASLKDEKKMRKVIKKMEARKINTLIFDASGLQSGTANKWLGEFIPFSNVVNMIFVSDDRLFWSLSPFQTKKAIVFMSSEKWEKNSTLFLDLQSKHVDDFSSKNVLGYIPSNQKNAQTIVFTAHYDHLGGIGNDVYFPGANDNASGTTMLFSLAKYFQTNKSSYNLLFIAMAGEEIGLLGSQYYIEHPSIPLNEIKFVLNLDIMGSGEDGITVVNGKIHEEAFKLLHQINEEGGFLNSVKARGETQNSDHYPFHKKGVPSFFIYTRGSNQNYHDIYDTHEEITFQAYKNIVELLIKFVNQI